LVTAVRGGAGDEPDAAGYFELVGDDEEIHPDVFVAGNPATSPVALFRLAAHQDRGRQPVAAMTPVSSTT
jgi:hypothetical protein